MLEPEAKIVIAFVLHGDGAGDIAVDQRGQGGDRGVLEQLVIAQRGRHLDQPAGDRAVLVDPAERRVAQCRATFARERDLPFELGRQPEIVAVEKRDEAALRLLDRGLARQRRAAIAGLADQFDPRILAAWLSITAAVLSVEQSSAIKNSQSPNVWACTDAMVSPIRRSTFHEGVMIETSGMPKSFQAGGGGPAMADSSDAAKVSSCRGLSI